MSQLSAGAMVEVALPDGRASDTYPSRSFDLIETNCDEFESFSFRCFQINEAPTPARIASINPPKSSFPKSLKPHSSQSERMSAA